MARCRVECPVPLLTKEVPVRASEYRRGKYQRRRGQDLEEPQRPGCRSSATSAVGDAGKAHACVCHCPVAQILADAPQARVHTHA